MKKLFLVAIVSLGLSALAAAAQDEAAVFDAARAGIYRSTPDQALTGPSRATPASVVAQFLRARGASVATVASLRTVSEGR